MAKPNKKKRKSLNIKCAACEAKPARFTNSGLPACQRCSRHTSVLFEGFVNETNLILEAERNGAT